MHSRMRRADLECKLCMLSGEYEGTIQLLFAIACFGVSRAFTVDVIAVLM